MRTHRKKLTSGTQDRWCNMAKIIVKIEVEEGADLQEVISECDYQFTHEKIVETEIVEVLDE